MMNNQVVLITGASSGIGQAAALFLAQQGAKVYGTSRHPSSCVTDDNTQNAGALRMIVLDVCSDESVAQAVDEVMKAEGRIDVLINNAGYGICGAIEDTTADEARGQFETNFFGVLSMCRAVLPIMRKQQTGLIINIGSVVGHLAVPYQALYSASKFAVEALTEALRLETKTFGIRAVVIDPGDIKSGFTASRRWVQAASGSPYEERCKRAMDAMIKSEENAPGPTAVVKAIHCVIAKKNPPVRVVVGWDYKLIVLAKRFLPARLVEFVVSKLF
jgi:short-subunit dehydrogenase